MSNLHRHMLHNEDYEKNISEIETLKAPIQSYPEKTKNLKSLIDSLAKFKIIQGYSRVYFHETFRKRLGKTAFDDLASHLKESKLFKIVKKKQSQKPPFMHADVSSLFK